MKNKIIISGFTLFYIVLLFLFQEFQITLPGILGQIFQFFHELLVFPILLSIPIQVIVFSLLWRREKYNKKSETFYALILSIISLVIVLYMTINR